MSTTDLSGLLAEDRWLKRLLRGLLDDHDASDVVQDTWVRALERETRGDAPGRGWLAVVARRLAFRTARAAARRARREKTAAREEAVASTEHLVERLDLQQRVARAVLILEEPFRTAVLLRYYEGLTPSEIAARLSVPAATVRTRVLRGLERIRERLDAEGEARDWRAMGLVLLSPGDGTAAIVPGLVLWSGKMLMAGAAVAAAVTVVLLAAWLMTTPSPSGNPAGPGGPVAEKVEVARQPDTPHERTAETARRAPAPSAAASAPAPSESRPTTMRLAGRVADTSGRSLAGVLVGIHVTDRRVGTVATESSPTFVELPDEGRIDVLGRSGPDGRFELATTPARGRLFAVGEHATVRGWSVHEPADLVDGIVLVAARSVDVAGQIVDEKDAPLAGVAVSIVEGQLSRFPEPLERTFAKDFKPTVTDGSGAFAFAALPGAPELELVLSRDGYEESRLPVPQVTTRDLRVVLRSAASRVLTLRGDVRDRRGVAVPGATVRFGLQDATTDERGCFAMVVADVRPEATLCALKVGHQPALLPRFAEQLGEWPGKTHEVTLTLGPPSLEIEGRVLDADGSPRRGFRVVLVDPTWLEDGWTTEHVAAGGSGAATQQPYGLETDVEGRFTIGGLSARDYRLRVFDRRTLLTLVSDPITAGSRDVTLRFPVDAVRRRLTGRVLRRGGEPAVGVPVGPSLVILDGPGGGVSVAADEQRWAHTDAEGRFELRDLPRRHVFLNVGGDDVHSGRTHVPPDHPDGGLEIRVASRVQFRIEPPARGEAPEAAEFRDAEGKAVSVTDYREGMSYARSRVYLVAGQTPVFSISDEAETVVWFRGSKEVGRQNVVLRTGTVNLIRP